ncbi:MAG TPA: TonB-dependent receptor plug domain-containing protein, partial [Chitinophagaceae bacterium]|nr:TonB-dependent receptor plug domain-containing protein [Chitinophagaceae bacterium]
MSFQNLLKVTGMLMLVFAVQVSFAQTRTITGKVTDSRDGSAMSGVTVSVKGGSAAQTQADGSFSISVPTSATTLSFSFVGFAPMDVAIDGRSTIDVSLVGTATSMSEVVVIGYGTARRKDLTGSITTISAKDFQKGNITTPEQLIAGKIAGVSIISNGGRPGSGSQILIRGGASLNASNRPLIVIDGVPVDNGSIAGGNDPLSFINPNDIETFTVLKDASATAIYGTRASNGIIMITTKRGRSGKFRVNFTSTNSISRITDKVDVLTGDEVRAVVNAKGTAAQKAQLGTANTDWQEEIYQTAFASDNNISFTGGMKTLPYRVSLGYLNQEGILRTDHLRKLSGSISLNPVILNNHLKIDLNLKASQQQYRFADQGAIGSAVYFDPTKPVMSGDK